MQVPLNPNEGSALAALQAEVHCMSSIAAQKGTFAAALASMTHDASEATSKAQYCGQGAGGSGVVSGLDGAIQHLEEQLRVLDAQVRIQMASTTRQTMSFWNTRILSRGWMASQVPLQTDMNRTAADAASGTCVCGQARMDTHWLDVQMVVCRPVNKMALLQLHTPRCPVLYVRSCAG